MEFEIYWDGACSADKILEFAPKGVKGFVLKSAGIEKVIAAIRAVAEGDSYFSEELLRGILNNMRDGAKVESSDSEISGRELEILYHCAWDCPIRRLRISCLSASGRWISIGRIC